MPLRRIVRVGNAVRRGAVLRLPLVRAGGTLRQFPLVVEEVVKIEVAPLRGLLRPGAFEATGDCAVAVSVAERVAPAKILFVDAGTGRSETYVLRGIGGAVRFAEGMAAGDQCDGLLIVHRHASERLANICRGGERIGIAVGAFR